MACSDESGVDPSILDESGDELPTLARMGEIRVIVSPRADELTADANLEIQARFVEYRDISAEDAASRAGLSPWPSDILRPGQCMASQELARFAGGDGEDAEADGLGSDPEVMLLDVGDVRVALGERDYVLPVSLVPDLVPWVSGVEYTFSEDYLPQAMFAPDGTSPTEIEVDGAIEAGLPSFSAAIDLPRSFSLVPYADNENDGALTLAWQPSEAGQERMVLELTAFAEGEASGLQVTCVVPDVGLATLPLSALESAGLGDGESIGVTARRSTSAYVDAGDFRRIRVVGEVRDRQLVAMPE